MSNRIELRGITKLKDCLLRSEYLIPDINENDRVPSWDGFIELYKNSNENKKKSDILARIPVQVKSHVNTVLSDNQISHSIKRADMVNYLNDGGVIFIIVVMKNYDEFKIFFEALTPIKLKRYIKIMKTKKSQAILLKEFPKDNVEEFTDIFFNFSHDMRKQVSENYLSLNEFNKNLPCGFDSFTISYQGIQYKDPFDYFLDHEATLYANHTIAGVSLQVDIVKLNTFGQEIDRPVLIENIEYYPSLKLSHSKDGTKVIIGNSISLMYFKEKGKADFNFNIQGTLSQRINDLEFVLALFKYKYFAVGRETPHSFLSYSSWESFDFDAKIKRYNEYLNGLLSIKKVLDILKIKDDLDYDKLSEDDIKNIELLLSSILYNHYQDLVFKKEIKAGVFRKDIKMSNIKVALLFMRRNDGKYKVTNFFMNNLNTSFQSNKDGESYNAPIYLTMTKEDFITLSNIDYDVIYNSFLGLELNEEFLGITNQLILNMINAYDTSRNKILLETCVKMIEWVEEKDRITNPAIYVLNKLQIVKRLRKYSDIEISQIIAIIENNSANDILVGANLLLGNKDAASHHFNKMPISEQDSFKKYPIYIFWKQEDQQDLKNGGA
jgi:hypothetical protein